MIAPKGPPALRRSSPPAGHVLCNARLADIEAELEQFAMNARRTPELVGQAHVLDQLAALQRDSRPPTAPSRFPTPERSKSSPVPTNDSLGPDDGQRV